MNPACGSADLVCAIPTLAYSPDVLVQTAVPTRRVGERQPVWRPASTTPKHTDGSPPISVDVYTWIKRWVSNSLNNRGFNEIAVQADDKTVLSLGWRSNYKGQVLFSY